MERYNPFRRTLLFSWALLIAMIASVTLSGQAFMDEPNMYLIICLISGFSMCHLAYFVIDELKEILNINCFIITRPLRGITETKKAK